MDYSNNVYTNEYIYPCATTYRHDDSFDNETVNNINTSELVSDEKINTYTNIVEEPTTRNKDLQEAIAEIKRSIEDEKNDEIFYEILLSQAPTQEDKRIIQSIINDERHHNRMLKELYASLTKMTAPISSMSRTNSSSTKYLENLEKALFGELDAVKKYRKIMAAMPDEKKYSMIMEIMTDELRHADKYNFLISKNMKKM